MKTILDHIEKIKSKPHHIRKNVAFSVAGGISALIAVIWLACGVSFGTFAINGSSYTDIADKNTGENQNDDSSAGIAGAAAAFQNANTPIHIEVIKTATSSSLEKEPEQTTIPF